MSDIGHNRPRGALLTGSVGIQTYGPWLLMGIVRGPILPVNANDRALRVKLNGSETTQLGADSDFLMYYGSSSSANR